MTVYLDTSSLVKLYVAEAESDRVRELVGQAEVVATSAIAYAETRATLARLHREGALGGSAFKLARRAFDEDWPRFLVLDVTAAVCREAGDLAERHSLRGYDSVHLASFLEVARQAGTAAVCFSSYDDRLNQAARAVLRPGEPTTRRK